LIFELHGAVLISFKYHF